MCRNRADRHGFVFLVVSRIDSINPVINPNSCLLLRLPFRLRGLLPSMGIRLDEIRKEVSVRVLPRPYVTVMMGQRVPGDDWSLAKSLQMAKFEKNPGETITLNLILVYNGRHFHHSREDCLAIYDKIRDMCNRYNARYRLPTAPFQLIEAGEKQQHWGPIKKLFAEKLPPNVFVLDFCKNDIAYHVLKELFLQKGYLSQMLNFDRYDHLRRMDRKSDTILQNLSRQMLNKCGEWFWFADLPPTIPEKVLLVGIDVFHAPLQWNKKSKEQTRKPSCGAIVLLSRENRVFSCYSEAVSVPAGQELGLGPQIAATICRARGLLRFNPDACYVFRDGVGEDQIASLKEDEVVHVREALKGEKQVGRVLASTSSSSSASSRSSSSSSSSPAAPCSSSSSAPDDPVQAIGESSETASTKKRRRIRKKKTNNTMSGDEQGQVQQAETKLEHASAPSDVHDKTVEREIPLIYVVAQKRIERRFVSECGKKPLPPGTVIDAIQGCNRDHYIFYLTGSCPSFSTPKPLKCTVIVQDAIKSKGKDREDIVQLVWALCHNYPNWVGSVKLPVVTQLAHKLAELAGGFPDGAGNPELYKSFANTLFYL